jgi:hypothetical protein
MTRRLAFRRARDEGHSLCRRRILDRLPLA